jgi:hypothetical protein
MGNRRKADEMNPHKLFATVMLVSIGATFAGLVAGNNLSDLYLMAQVLGITLACIGAVLFATRRFWKNARRLG